MTEETKTILAISAAGIIFILFVAVTLYYAAKSAQKQMRRHYMNLPPPPKDDPIWVTKDGRVLKVSEMEIGHVKSTVAWMEKQCYADKITDLFKIEKLENDRRYRAMKRRLEDHERPAPLAVSPEPGAP